MTRSFRILSAFAISLALVKIASSATILSVDYFLTPNDRENPANYVDIKFKLSTEPGDPTSWEDHSYSMNRVQVDNIDENHNYYSRDTLWVMWDYGNDGWGTDYAPEGFAFFSTRTAITWNNPLSYFHYQFYGDAVRLIWTNDPTVPKRVPDAASTLSLFATGLCAMGLLAQSKVRRGDAR